MSFNNSNYNPLISFLRPLDLVLHDKQVSDIVYNGLSRWYVEKSGHWYPLALPLCDDLWVKRLIALLAAQHRVSVNKRSPFLSATLPIGARVQCVLPPVSEHPLLAIRLLRQTWDWKRFQQDQQECQEGSDKNKHITFQGELPLEERLREAMHHRQTILIAGATSSGKTSVLQSLLSVCKPNERLIVLEDSPELQFPNEYHALTLRAQPSSSICGGVSLSELLRTTLRLRPDRIIVGEIRGEEAYDFLSACQTGHKGVLATIHASSASLAKSRLSQLCLANPSCAVPLTVLQEWVNYSVPLVVHCSRNGGHFSVSVNES